MSKFILKPNTTLISNANDFLVDKHINKLATNEKLSDFYKRKKQSSLDKIQKNMSKSFNEEIVIPKNFKNLAKTYERQDIIEESLASDVAKEEILTGELATLGAFATRILLIATSESNNFENVLADGMASRNGVDTWIWGISDADKPRFEHSILAGVESPIGESPADGGEMPGVLPNCQCEIIYKNE